jgi:hypothetical protein
MTTSVPSRAVSHVSVSEANVATAAALASSPAACPPMPSATTSSVGPAYPESSLPVRTSPTSERAA